MYLSRLILDPRSRRVRREVSEPYEMHRTLMNAFLSADTSAPGRVLFRLDTPPDGQMSRPGLVLLVQSEVLPDWRFLAGAPGYLLAGAGENPAVKPFQPTFSGGQRLAFRLRANPTVKRDGKRRGLCSAEEQRAWLERKAQESGFVVLAADVMREGAVGGEIHRSEEETHALRLLAVRFDGLLQVGDPPRFLAALQQGIGSGKGLGFGLLSLARA